MINDQRFISFLVKGDQRKFRLLMENTSDELFGFALGFVRNREIAEEIVSDVFVKIWKKHKELQRIKNLKSYLFICVKNECLSYFRKVKNDKIIYLDEINDYQFMPVEGNEKELIDTETIEQIYNAIEELPPKCKLAFTLAKINGLKHREIAEIMEVSPKTVNNHLVLALKRILESIKIQNKTEAKYSPLKKASLFTFFF